MSSKTPRLKSIRAARRLHEETLAAHLNGDVTAQSLTAVTGAIKTWAELFLAEQELMALEMDVEKDTHPLGMDGGYVLGRLKPTPAQITQQNEATVDGDGKHTSKRVHQVRGFKLPADFEE